MQVLSAAATIRTSLGFRWKAMPRTMFSKYISDIGLFVEMLGEGTRADILQGNLGGFKGAIFEIHQGNSRICKSSANL